MRDKPINTAAEAPLRPQSGRPAMRRAVLEVLRQWELTPNGGAPVCTLEELFAQYLGGRHTLAVSSGTTGLEVVLRAGGVGPGDEVVLPAYDWGAAAGAALRCGAQPVFADVDPITATLDAESLASRIGPRTRAVVVTHYAGCPADLDAVMPAARRHGLFVVEDCAQALGARYHERPVGTFGDAAVFSFGWGKLLCAGEGGLLAFQDVALWRRAVGLSQHPLRQLRQGAAELGDLAMNARLHPLAAALVLAQWELWPQWLERRRFACLTLSEALRSIPGTIMPQDPPYGRHSFHRFLLTLPNEQAACQVRQRLIGDGYPVTCGTVQEPLHRRAPFRARFRPGDCPQAEDWCRAALCVQADWTRASSSWVRCLARALRRAIISLPGGDHAGECH
jgi:dTDP-4-amino-4,6-dideoxygalactose transaminase